MGERAWQVGSNIRPRLFISKNQKTAPATTTTSFELGASCTHNQSMALSSRNQLQNRQLKQHRQQQQQQQLEAPQDARLEAKAAAASAAAGRRRRVKHVGWRAGSTQLGPITLPGLFGCVALVFVVAASLLFVCGNFAAPTLTNDEQNSGPTTRLMQDRSVADNKAALEAELNSILQQQELGQETNSKLLSEAIISRLMLGNLTDIDEGGLESGSSSSSGEMGEQDEGVALSAPDAMRLRRVLSYLQNYELAQTDPNFPVLPAIQAATIKRASAKMGSYLRQQTQNQHGGQRQLNGYGRVNSFDFGLGKRPDSSVSSNILRFGDSAGGHMASVSGSGLGKRPSAHRYDFGLGKRVASPAYPRYDFGLGKRAPNSRLRYDFGLGK